MRILNKDPQNIITGCHPPNFYKKQDSDDHIFDILELFIQIKDFSKIGWLFLAVLEKVPKEMDEVGDSNSQPKLYINGKEDAAKLRGS